MYVQAGNPDQIRSDECLGVAFETAPLDVSFLQIRLLFYHASGLGRPAGRPTHHVWRHGWCRPTDGSTVRRAVSTLFSVFAGFKSRNDYCQRIFHEKFIVKVVFISIVCDMKRVHCDGKQRHTEDTSMGHSVLLAKTTGEQRDHSLGNFPRSWDFSQCLGILGSDMKAWDIEMTEYFRLEIFLIKLSKNK